MQIFNTHVRVGDRVRARKQRWYVTAAQTYDRCQVVTLRGIDPRNAGAKQTMIVPFDTLEHLEPAERLRIVGPRRWQRQCRALVASDRPSGGLSTAHRARIRLMPYQLEPALALLRGLGSRVLIADEVGLGKTIQAGLVVSELRAAGAARVLIVTPAGLREQWTAELRERFGLEAVVLDMREARLRAASLPVGLNPWLTVPLVIASIDYLKRPEVLPAVQACRWDVVIVDEAHGVTPASDRHDALSALCKRAPYVVLLTATPHNGDRSAFASLCRLGELEREQRGHLLVFRRTRADAGLNANRRVHCVRVEQTIDERLMHEQLSRFVSAIRLEKRDRTDWLALATLHKRALSSAHSLRASVARRLTALEERASGTERQPTLPMADDDGELDLADDAPGWTTPALADCDRERAMLIAVADAAGKAAARESKLIALSRLVTRLARLGEPAIVFTEYRDTLLHLERTLAERLAERRLPSIVVGILHGGLSRDERRTVLDDFRSRRRPILLSTDAGGQGLNLHHTCRVVVNLELPWNPMKLEQRIGRVDRIGQQRRVHAFNLILSDSGEARIFERLRARIERARQDIDVNDPLSSQDDEAIGFRLVAGESDTAGAVDAEPREPCLRLTSAAAVECERLTRARMCVRPDAATGSVPFDEPSLESGTLVTHARSSLTRSRLSGLALVVFHTLVEDHCGRIVSSQVTPVTVAAGRLRGRGDRRSASESILRSLKRWQPPEPMRDHHMAFWATRIARERAIAEDIGTSISGLVQPGLFDRRVEHDAESRRSAAQEAAGRAAALESWSGVESTRHRPALILLP